MRSFENCNPIVVTVYFLSVIGILMFSQNPILLLLGFFGAFVYSLIQSRHRSVRTYLFYLLLFVLLALLNPLTSHNGKTVLFVLNDAPITLEAMLYGVVSAGILLTVLLLFRSFSEIMTRDRLLYVFGSLSPKLALILSMGIRYVALLQDRWKKISETQRALGLYKEDNVFDKVKSDLRVFSILITWALENGITTADSMAARGYGTHKRTYFTLYQFRKSDALVLTGTIACAALTLAGMLLGRLDFAFYPSIVAGDLTPLGIVAYTAYGLLSVLPILFETEASLRWRYLQSKI
ncbi:MAG: energy-coupling factor transporter transmembrane protein EcfT [Ruminococcaceae bacterium]|nr:energy-coupling factor transporter transmembrane protein EcfT [Oscillospiraceae bacterium]